MKTYTIGIDFGTLSARGIVADVENGCEVAEAVFEYPHGVMDSALPCGKKLPAQYALQHPRDYLQAVQAVCRELLENTGIAPEQIKGIGIDFTACTILPVDAEGKPLCENPKYAHEPHAYVKLWKHHAAQQEADDINALAEQRGEPWLKIYGGRLSSEWAMPKILEICREARDVYADTARFMEAGDWVMSTLVGEEVHGLSFAGFKAIYQDGAYPSNDFMKALDEGLDGIVGTKLSTKIFPLDHKNFKLSAMGSELTGLNVGTAVAVTQLDAHAAMPAMKIIEDGALMLIMGTSGCHLTNSKSTHVVDGICGYVRDGVIPGLTTYEAGQAAVGDIFDWYVKNAVPYAYYEEAKARGISVHGLLMEKAEKLSVGQSGLLALDWWNGVRSTLDDSTLSGMLVGLTLQTKPEEIYRALLEATAFGTRKIVDNFEEHGVAIHSITAAGGIAQKNPLMVQIYADVLGRTIHVSKSTQAGALGSAIYAGVAADVYPTVEAAAEKMGAPILKTYYPNAENKGKYDALYDHYHRLYRYFGMGGNDVMKDLRTM